MSSKKQLAALRKMPEYPNFDRILKALRTRIRKLLKELKAVTQRDFDKTVALDVYAQQVDEQDKLLNDKQNKIERLNGSVARHVASVVSLQNRDREMMRVLRGYALREVDMRVEQSLRNQRYGEGQMVKHDESPAEDRDER